MSHKYGGDVEMTAPRFGRSREQDIPDMCASVSPDNNTIPETVDSRYTYDRTILSVFEFECIAIVDSDGL